MSANATKRPRAAFTLIELLVVIAVIGVLAAVLTPALNKALEKSRTVTCLSNVRCLGTAMNLYAADHDGWMPTSGILLSTAVPDLLSYMGNKSKQAAQSAWMCPADRKIAERAVLNGYVSNPDEHQYYSYSFVEAFVPRCSTDPNCSTIYTQSNYWPILNSAVVRPSASVFLADGGWWRVVNNSLTFRHQRVQFRHLRPREMDAMELEQGNAFWGSLGYNTKGDFRQALANVFYFDGHAASVSYATYAKNLNAFIAAGYSDRSGMTPVPVSEYQ